MARVFIIIGALLGLVGVAAGAFGAHALPPEVQDVWRTATAYQMWHALGVMCVGILIAVNGDRGHPHPASPGGGGGKTLRAWAAAGWLFVAGVVVFSGSLYVLVLSGQKWLGAVTPFGGAALMAGWVSVVIGAWGNMRL